MIYEDMTYEKIIERCLARVPGGVDKREGSIIFDAIAPAAAELAVLYTELGSLMDRVFPDTQTGEDLSKKVVERGLERFDASCAVRLAYFKDADGAPFEPHTGARFTGGDINYAVSERIAPGQYKMTAETAGTVGNHYFGKLIPIDYLAGLATAQLADILIHGEDQESDESLRKRYFASLNLQSFGGNIDDYKTKAKQMQGVGGVKVMPVWNGGGTVMLIIISSDWGVPSDTLIEDIQNAFDPVRGSGEGLGIAPIGHVVTVSPVKGFSINVSFSPQLADGLSWLDVKTGLESAVSDYFAELSHLWDEDDGIIVRLTHIETRLLAVPGVIDLADTTLNGAAENISLNHDEIPVLGEVFNAAS